MELPSMCKHNAQEISHARSGGFRGFQGVQGNTLWKYARAAPDNEWTGGKYFTARRSKDSGSERC